MSLPVPSSDKTLSEQELALLATSPTWTQSPNGWFDRHTNEDETLPTNHGASSPPTGHFEQPGFLDEADDVLLLSSELRGSDMDHVDYIPAHYWDRLFTPDERSRKAAMSQICKGLRTTLTSSPTAFEHTLPRINRLLSECPYQDVHDALSDTLKSLSQDMTAEGISMPILPRPSRMFRENVLSVTTEVEPQATLFKASWLNTGRVTHLFRIMAWHPSFLERFTETYDFLLRADGPLPFAHRHYIALVAAARFKCYYLVKQQEQEFLLAGGDPTWLEGVEKSAPKLQRLLEVNAILAHQPWRLLPTHIAELVKTAGTAERWSVSELVQACVIMATFRALAGLAIGMGINLEVDINVEDAESSTTTTGTNTQEMESDTLISSASSAGSASAAEPAQQQQQLTSKLATRSANDDMSTPADAEKRKELFEAAGDSAASGSPTASQQNSPKVSANLPTTALPTLAPLTALGNFSEISEISAPEESGYFAKYANPYPIRHTDFDVRSRDYSVFHIQDWSWEEHAYELLERSYDRDLATCLDAEFTNIFELTYNQVNGQKGVDTAPFRRSVWYYVHRIHGILHDDYNYATVNELLLRNLKKFTKDLSLTPWQVSPQDLVNLGYSLSPEEKCHIALLATEARKQAELMYALHAISKHLSSS